MFDRRLLGQVSFRVLFVALGIAAVAACSGGKSSPPQSVPPTLSPGAAGSLYVPTPSPSPSPSPTPVIPAAIQTSIPLSINTTGNAVSTPLPAPSGYTSKVTIPIVTAGTGTTFQFVSSVTLPTALPILQGKARVATSVRIPQASASNLLPIYFTSIVPSAAVTVAGDVSVSQVFPAGALSTSSSYYLAFYDSTLPTPAWQTIEGPVTTTDGVTLTFGGTIKSFTFQANQLYGFAIFSLANTTATPPPAPQLVAYFGNGAGGIDEYTESGTKLGTLAIPSESFALDDSGNIYAELQPTPAPNAASSATPAPTFAKFPYGSASPSATFNPSAIPSFGFTGFVGGVSGSGELAIAYTLTPYNISSLSQQTDVWNAGVSGAPSYSIPLSTVGLGTFVAHDGTLYIQNITSGGLSQISVYPPGSSTPSRVIPEQLVPAAQQSTFYANYGAVGPDGTLYITEYTFIIPDQLAGLYVYHPDGTESFYATTGGSGTPGSITGDPGPEGVDVDAAGNIYVSNDNEGYDSTNNYALANDTLNDVEVFSPTGTVLRHITGTLNPITTAVASDGTAFISGFGTSAGGPSATYIVAPGASTATQVTSYGTGSIVLYDGNRATTGRTRLQSIGGSGTAHGSAASVLARLAALRARGHF